MLKLTGPRNDFYTFFQKFQIVLETHLNRLHDNNFGSTRTFSNDVIKAYYRPLMF